MGVVGLHFDCNVNNGVTGGSTPCVATCCGGGARINNVRKAVDGHPGPSLQ